MDPNETMVEENFDNEAADDAQPGDIAEEDESQSLEEFVNEGREEEPAREEQKQAQPEGTTEPGWFKKRWASNVEKLSAQIRSEVRNEYEAQIAPLRERLIEMDAQELVRNRKVADIETARELIRLRQGLPVSQGMPQEQPRNENGQFAPKMSEDDIRTNERLAILRHQRDQIAAEGGPDVVNEFMNNEEIKMAVVRGEMDFYDVARHMKQAEGKNRKNPPAPTRSPNGASGSEKSTIAGMTKEQFARFDKRISEGARYNLK